MIIIQVESQKALDNLEGIASTPGIDAVFVGPLDLSTNLGIPGQYDHPKFRDALDKVLTTCKKYDIAPGIYAYNIEIAKSMISRGFRFVSLMSDLGVMKTGFKEALKEFGRTKEKA